MATPSYDTYLAVLLELRKLTGQKEPTFYEMFNWSQDWRRATLPMRERAYQLVYAELIIAKKKQNEK